ncbi:hypothetical protein D3C80_1921600 [compost metagenome]
MDGGDQGLRRHRLGGVQAAVDPDDRLAFGGQRAGLRLGHAFRPRQAARDALVVVYPSQVGG